MITLPTGTKTEGRYLTIRESKVGIYITLTEDGREYVADWYHEQPDFSLFADLFDDFAGNGWAMLNDIGLTSCQIIISPDAEYDEEGVFVDADNVYWHERYQIEDAIEQLLQGDLFLLRAT